MNRSELEELQYITHIDNVPSILARGILSHRKAQALDPLSIAMEEIQQRRAQRRVPGGLPLHQYANIYLCARNPMLYKRHDMHQDLTVLRVSTEILDLPGAVITDGNAASDYTAFFPSPAGLARIQRDLVFAEYWTDDDTYEHWRKKRSKCAEVLIPNAIEPGFVIGAYVSCRESEHRLGASGIHLSILIDAWLFFQ